MVFSPAEREAVSQRTVVGESQSHQLATVVITSAVNAEEADDLRALKTGHSF